MARLRVEVIYALPSHQEIVGVELEPGSTALDAVRSSGLAERHPEGDPTNLRLGIFGVEVPPGTRLKEGDRVEIYRPLAIDPKEARRARARRARHR